MNSYKTLVEAIDGLKRLGYTQDFNHTQQGLDCPAQDQQLHPEHFAIDAVYRFEGMSSTDDNAILYAISSDQGLKGTLVDAYGVYAASLSPEMIEKLRVAHSEIR